MPRPSSDARPLGEARMPNRSFRLVCPPEAVPAVEALLAAQGFVFEPEPFSPWCRRLLDEPGPLGASLAAFFGLIHIQDRSSMLPPLLLDPPAGASVLDMCAAPGGKTGFLAQLVGPDGFVLANEPSPDRLATLRQTLLRENLAQVATVSRTDLAPVLPEGAFSHILLDPPCSGWGTLDKHPQAAKIWRGDKVGSLVALQRVLLATASRLLAPGGRLLYSTCTTNVAENEEQTRFALDTLPLRALPLTPPPGFVFEAPHRPDIDGILRVDSAASAAQGFYMALFQKEGAPQAPALVPEGAFPGTPVPPARLTEAGCDLSRLPAGAALRAFTTNVFALPAPTAALPPDLRFQGFPLGTLSAGKFRPQARCRLLLPDFTPATGLNATELSRIEALLTGQSLPAEDVPSRPGLYCRDLPLGWLTRKGTRLLWSDR